MDGPENSPQQETSTEKAYPVGPRTPVFSHLAEALTPLYKKGLEEAVAKGSEGEFHRSRLGVLMNQVMEQFPDPNTLPKNPKLVLSREDIDMIERIIPTPPDAAKARLLREWIRELNSDFKSAELKENAKHLGKNTWSKLKKWTKLQ